MRGRGLSAALAALLAWGAWGGAPATARAGGFGDDSQGAAIAAGLAIAVAAVYGLVVLKADMESYADAGTGEAIARAAAAAEESPVVLEALRNQDRFAPGAAAPDGLAVGWRVSF